jgi:hypothetical protein
MTGAIAGSQPRDLLVQPFTSTSIWNTPIGSGACYLPANLAPATVTALVSDQHVIVMTPTAPPLSLNLNPALLLTSRCDTSGVPLATAPIPNGFSVPGDPALGPAALKNYPLVAVMADGNTLVQGEPFARCTLTGPGTLHYVRNAQLPPATLNGDGLEGFDGGSGLSALGGTIRLGELLPGAVITHALQVDVDGWANLYPGTASTCYRWPATKCDTYGPTTYRGINPKLTMGALLALPPPSKFNTASLLTTPGRMLATAFQQYGAYIANDASSPVKERSVNNIVTELGPSGDVLTQFATAWKYPFETNAPGAYPPWSQDIATIFANLQIVDNNSSTSIGGGGT